MAGDERRAEIEAVAAIIRGWGPTLGRGARTTEVAQEVISALDRLRDARGDDEAAPLGTPERDAQHDLARLKAECYGPRSPQSEDHEAGIPEAAVDALIWESPYGLQRHTARRMLARALCRVSPSRDGTVGEDHEARDEQGRRLYPTVLHGEAATAARLAEHSPSRDGTVAVEDEVDQLREIERAARDLMDEGQTRAEPFLRLRRLLAEFARPATGEQTDHGGDQ